MKQPQPVEAKATMKPCVICLVQCLPYGRTSQGNHICSMAHNHEWYKLTLEEQQRRDNAASQRAS